MTKEENLNMQAALDYLNDRIRELKKYPGYFHNRDAEMMRLYKRRAQITMALCLNETLSESINETIS